MQPRDPAEPPTRVRYQRSYSHHQAERMKLDLETETSSNSNSCPFPHFSPVPRDFIKAACFIKAKSTWAHKGSAYILFPQADVQLVYDTKEKKKTLSIAKFLLFTKYKNKLPIK